MSKWKCPNGGFKEIRAKESRYQVCYFVGCSTYRPEFPNPLGRKGKPSGTQHIWDSRRRQGTLLAKTAAGKPQDGRAGEVCIGSLVRLVDGFLL